MPGKTSGESRGASVAAPVTWLASYPRSGNTLLRQILKHCFGLLSQSLYQDEDFANPGVRDAVGHEDVGHNARQFVALARRAGRSLYVKTHELPPADHHPAIYVVRDGRSAVVSHTHYLRDVLGRDISLADVIAGKAGLSWSHHVRAWAMPARANTLVVRYEDLAAGRRDTLSSATPCNVVSICPSTGCMPCIPLFSAAVRMRPISRRWMTHRCACSHAIMATCCGPWVMAAPPEQLCSREARSRRIQKLRS
jgi:hypothetical protein